MSAVEKDASAAKASVPTEALAEEPVTLSVRLPEESAAHIHQLAEMSGYSADTVASVLLAMASMRWKEQENPQEGTAKSDADESEAGVALPVGSIKFDSLS